jgi:hypothetical protein
MNRSIHKMILNIHEPVLSHPTFRIPATRWVAASIQHPTSNIPAPAITMTDDEIRERDKRLTAAHEAGHFVVATYHGQFIRAKIEESGAADLSSDRAWVGQVEIDAGEWTPAMVIAGELAVALIEEPEYWDDVDNLVADTLEDVAEDPHYLSDTDRAAFPNDVHQQRTAILEAANILGSNRALFEWAANELYSREEVNFDRPFLACEFENTNRTDWLWLQRGQINAHLNRLAKELYAIWQSPTPDRDAAKAAELEVRRLQTLLARVEQKIRDVWK